MLAKEPTTKPQWYFNLYLGDYLVGRYQTENEALKSARQLSAQHNESKIQIVPRKFS